ncbi:ion channel [Paraliomyxa miuraensis]|uniref:ion channel n=1 Tax=Paraliomyxa miuraensis TaxID=376150 RepID=UPI00224E0DE2|nr:ion channel [Paraliomyxa miuraensis]MCX4242767.1 ion channel [Paraliomyxa miuraensis]
MAPQHRPNDPRNAVRVGLRLSPLTDLYYHLMRGSWLLLIGVLGLAYLFTNLVFAGLYLVQPDGINGGEPGSFVDAFAFSVQTLSTIGYGTLAPRSGVVHTLVTFEAMTGLLGTAIATGLVFTKFAQPRAKVMFSSNLLVQRRNGRPALVFRVGNARGNEIIEASLRVSALVPEVTSEGESMRRLVDLVLLRSTTPMFAMTWTVIHEIDEASPLHGRDEASYHADGLRFIVSMTGIDATFSQTVHARHIYDPDDVRFGARFVDIVDNTEDGRLRIDYQRFHEIEVIDSVDRSK